MRNRLARYRKMLVALAAPVGVLAAAYLDGVLTTEEIAAIMVAVLTALGVGAVPNAPTVRGEFERTGR